MLTHIMAMICVNVRTCVAPRCREHASCGGIAPQRAVQGARGLQADQGPAQHADTVASYPLRQGGVGFAGLGVENVTRCVVRAEMRFTQDTATKRRCRPRPRRSRCRRRSSESTCTVLCERNAPVKEIESKVRRQLGVCRVRRAAAGRAGAQRPVSSLGWRIAARG